MATLGEGGGWFSGSPRKCNRKGRLNWPQGTVLALREGRVAHILVCPAERHRVGLQRKKREGPRFLFFMFSTLKPAAFLI